MVGLSLSICVVVDIFIWIVSEKCTPGSFDHRAIVFSNAINGDNGEADTRYSDGCIHWYSVLGFVRLQEQNEQQGYCAQVERKNFGSEIY